MASNSQTAPHSWPRELRVNPARNALSVLFDDGARAVLAAEKLRVQSPSAEVRGHGGERPLHERAVRPGRVTQGQVAERRLGDVLAAEVAAGRDPGRPGHPYKGAATFFGIPREP